MSFSLPYLHNGRGRRRMELPDFYLGFISSEDISQICHGLKDKTKNSPSDSRVRNSAILLAKKRKEGDRGRR